MADHPRKAACTVIENSFKKKSLLAANLVFLLLGLYIVWRTAYLFLGVFKARPSFDDCIVNVQGNVLRPGAYRVPQGITQFEILKVAGIRPTSDIAPFDLTQQISDNQQLEVGTMPNPVAIKKQSDNVRLEFSLGQLSIITPGGKSRAIEEGLAINAGDRIISEEKSQAELSVNTYSRIDIDEYSECAFDKINEDEKGKKMVAVFQKSGTCWYKIVYTAKSELFRVTTPFITITVAGKGADFMIVARQDEIDIHDMDGLLLIERSSGAEAINMISGQSAVNFSDNRPFQVSQLASEVTPADRFSLLTKEKTNFMMRHMPLNFMFCAVPSVYYFISIQFESGKVHAVSIPGSVSVEEFVQGCSTLDQAFLYGGAVFVSTLIEQIMDARIPKYCVFTKEDVIRAAGSFGGITVDIDEKAASTMRLTKGAHKLASEQVIAFLKPSISGTEDFYSRQVRVIKAVFEGLRSKNIILTTLLTEQLLANLETNFTSSEVMNQYAKFNEVTGWSFKEHALPTKKVTQNGRARDDPNLEECKTLLQNN